MQSSTAHTTETPLPASAAGKRFPAKKPLAIAAVLIAVALACAGVWAHYVMLHDREAEMIAAGFHISSDYLKEVPDGGTAARYQVSRDVQTGTFDVDLYNWEVDNTDSTSEVDITYRVTVSGAILEGITRDGETVSPKSGSGDAAVYELPRAKEKGSADDPEKATHTLTLAPTAGEVTLTVTATGPYEKTLTAVFDATGVEVKQVDLGGGVTQLVIITNQYAGDVRLQWDKARFFPNAGVNEQSFGWTVGYEGYVGYNGGEAVRAVQKDATYYFEFNSCTVGNITADFSTTGVTYDYASETYKGATIHVE